MPNTNDVEEIAAEATSKMADTKAFYTRHALEWTNSHTDSFNHEPEFQIFRSLVTLIDAQVVDLGCASGIHVPLFRKEGPEMGYLGIDNSETFLQIARHLYPDYTFMHGDVTDLDTLPKRTFDAFWCTAMFMHVPRALMPVAAANINKICRRGAIGYITLPVAHPAGKKINHDTRHFELIPEQEQRELMAGFGWKIRYFGTKDGRFTPRIWRSYIVEI